MQGIHFYPPPKGPNDYPWEEIQKCNEGSGTSKVTSQLQSYQASSRHERNDRQYSRTFNDLWCRPRCPRSKSDPQRHRRGPFRQQQATLLRNGKDKTRKPQRRTNICRRSKLCPRHPLPHLQANTYKDPPLQDRRYKRQSCQPNSSKDTSECDILLPKVKRLLRKTNTQDRGMDQVRRRCWLGSPPCKKKIEKRTL